MKYPAIYRTREGADYLYASKDSYYSYTLKDWGESTFSDINEHVNDKNITTEYLANTYGEVKSKEHAEFIIELAGGYGADNYSVIFLDEAKSFAFDRVGDLKFYKAIPSELSSVSNLKKITIPLPPECEKPPIGGGQSMDYNNCRCSTAPALNDEWPKVGEIVLTASKSKAKVLATHNKKAWVEYVSGAHGFNTLNIASLSKPKTPEQELAEKLIEKYKHLSKEEQAFSIARDIIQNAIDKYDIKKKY